ncbi:alpha/beta fold hydrolase [Lysobacter solisilvae (ex Woo and Kim 2020)]|uniref:Alpha/beta hydrolase n=1 Tax=Agrilutibacter terrestris TaxID=2865112 RepID=A0A7H0FUG8_9GAMM|nr:alpha/beta hydrolase [Lysobacter terrestris]QNP39684.1 alpha/beta hydrolase [Lysobacter terrestris]
MTFRFARYALALLLLAIATAIVLVALDPYRLVRAEFARQRLAAGLARGTITVAGHRWVYAYSDDAPRDAPVVVMLHGFTGSKENWYPLAERLRGRYRLLLPDLPGWGESERKPGEDYGFPAQATRVDAFVRALSPKGTSFGASPGRPVVLLGHSMGGGIAALVAARHPDDIARVGLFDAAGVRFRDNRFGREVLAGANPFAVRDAASLQRYLDTVFFDEAAKPLIPWPASSALIARRRHDAAFEQSVLDRIGRSEERFLPGIEAARIRQPALLLWCRQDAVIDPSALELYAARIPQAARVMLDDCGHMSIMERPDAVAAAVTALIEKPASGNPK